MIDIWADRHLQLVRETPKHIDVLTEHWRALPEDLRKAILWLVSANLEQKEIIEKFREWTERDSINGRSA